MRSGATTGNRSAIRTRLEKYDWPVIVRWIAVATSVVLFTVHVMGTLVTDSGSQAGCGNSWPLCKGQFIPGEFARSTAIEFSHRLGVPLVTLLMIALIVGSLALWRDRLEIKILAPMMFLSLFLQALLGGLAVMYPTSAVILAFHFGVSSISVASVIVTTLFIFGLNSWDRMRDRAIAVGFRALVWGVAIYTYVVIYLGAYVLHTNATLACTSWPLCAPGQLLPQAVEPTIVNMTHRTGAAILTLLVVWIFFWARRLRRARPDIYLASIAALTLILLQVAEGAVVVLSHAHVWAEVMHSAFIALFFSVMVYLCMAVLRRPENARHNDTRKPQPQRRLRPSKTATAAVGR